MFRKSVFLFILLLFGSSVGALDLTTNLVNAKPGSWVRRYAPNGYTYTDYVLENADGKVAIQHLKNHEGRIQENTVTVYSHERIKSEGADPDAPDAKRETISHNGRKYDVKVIVVSSGSSKHKLYISNQVPVNGVVRTDLLFSETNQYPLWTDQYGDSPDDLIRKNPPRE